MIFRTNFSYHELLATILEDQTEKPSEVVTSFRKDGSIKKETVRFHPASQKRSGDYTVQDHYDAADEQTAKLDEIRQALSAILLKQKLSAEPLCEHANPAPDALTPMHLLWAIVHQTNGDPRSKLGHQHYNSMMGHVVLSWLIEEKLIEEDPNDDLYEYSPTPRLRQYVEALQAVPLPEGERK